MDAGPNRGGRLDLSTGAWRRSWRAAVGTPFHRILDGIDAGSGARRAGSASARRYDAAARRAHRRASGDRRSAPMARAVAVGGGRLRRLVRGMGGRRVGQPRSSAAVRPVHGATEPRLGAPRVRAARFAGCSVPGTACGAITAPAHVATLRRTTIWEMTSTPPGSTKSSTIPARSSPIRSNHSRSPSSTSWTQSWSAPATGPGEQLLEIGCGWGPFAETAARAGVRIHAVTLSIEQQRAVNERIARAGLTGVDVTLTDYRDVDGRYGRGRQHRDGRGGRSGILGRVFARDCSRTEAGRPRRASVHYHRRRYLRCLCG